MLCHVPLCIGQTPKSAQRVSDFYTKEDGFSGTVTVVKNGVIVSNTSHGMANVELGTPNTTKTRFAIGSVSKQFTAAAILLLQERGLLKTTDTVASRYPGTPEAWKDVTLRQLLQHTSGIPDSLNVWGNAGGDNGEPTPEQVVTASYAKPLVAPPGTSMAYNNTGYILLGLVVEKVSGEKLGDFLRKTFFTPLQMRDTGLASSLEVISQMASGYAPKGDALEKSIAVPYSSVFAAGAMYSTGGDLAKWLTALHTGKVLSAASYAEMTHDDSYGYGYGLVISKQDGEQEYSHDGKVPGFASETDFFPKSKTGIVILSNRMNRMFLSPGGNAIENDLIHLAVNAGAAVRSVGNEEHVDAAKLKRCTGTYNAENAPGSVRATLELHGNNLVLSSPGKATTTFVARSERSFYVKEWEGRRNWNTHTKGRVC